MLSLLLEESEPHVKQICTDPDTFGTTTIPAYQDVGACVYFRNDFSILLNSTCTLALSGRGTCLGVNKA